MKVSIDYNCIYCGNDCENNVAMELNAVSGVYGTKGKKGKEVDYSNKIALYTHKNFICKNCEAWQTDLIPGRKNTYALKGILQILGSLALLGGIILMFIYSPIIVISVPLLFLWLGLFALGIGNIKKYFKADSNAYSIFLEESKQKFENAVLAYASANYGSKPFVDILK